MSKQFCEPELFIGLDLSLTGTACIVLDTAGEIRDCLRIQPKVKGVERLAKIRHCVQNIIARQGVIGCPPEKILCAVEGYAYGAVNAAHSQGELGGVIRLMLYQNGVPYVDIAPSMVKKFATGKGNAKKEQVMLHVLKRWGHHFETNDEADAFVLAMIARSKFCGAGLSDWPTLIKSQIEVLDKLGEPIIKKSA